MTNFDCEIHRVLSAARGRKSNIAERTGYIRTSLDIGTWQVIDCVAVDQRDAIVHAITALSTGNQSGVAGVRVERRNRLV